MTHRPCLLATSLGSLQLCMLRVCAWASQFVCLSVCLAAIAAGFCQSVGLSVCLSAWGCVGVCVCVCVCVCVWLAASFRPFVGVLDNLKCRWFWIHSIEGTCIAKLRHTHFRGCHCIAHRFVSVPSMAPCAEAIVMD